MHGVFTGRKNCRQRECRSCPHGGKQAAGQAEDCSASVLYGRPASSPDCRSGQNTGRNRTEQITPGPENIKKGIGGCFKWIKNWMMH